MGFAMLMCNCYGCGNPMSANPHKVPSVRVDGVRQPLCKSCVAVINKRREEEGLEPFVIPKDAYEPIDEMLL